MLRNQRAAAAAAEATVAAESSVPSSSAPSEPLWRTADRSRGPQYANKLGHLRGSVNLICGDMVYLEMRKVNGDLVRRETGPSENVSQRDEEMQRSRAFLAKLNADVIELQYTNSYVKTLDPNFVMMRLDAEFSEDPIHGVVVLETRDLDYVMQHQWGAKQLSDGCWYAFTASPHVSCPWLHDYLVGANGDRFARFADGMPRNCSRSNLVVMPKFTPKEDLIEINSDEPTADGTYKHVYFDKPQRKYPHGRWRLKWTQGSNDKFGTFNVSADTVEAKATAKQLCLNKRAELIATARAQTREDRNGANVEIPWAETHADAREPQCNANAVVTPSMPLFVTPNVAFKSEIQNDGFQFGPFLRGNLSKHAREMWCLKRNGFPQYEHFGTEQAAIDKLLSINRMAPYTLNAWKLVDGGIRHVQLDGVGMDNTFMIVDDREDIISALSKHIWIARPCADAAAAASGRFEVRNANAASQWQRAIDVVAFVGMAGLQRRGKPLIPSAAYYFQHFETRLLTDPHDLRICRVESALHL